MTQLLLGFAYLFRRTIFAEVQRLLLLGLWLVLDLEAGEAEQDIMQCFLEELYSVLLVFYYFAEYLFQESDEVEMKERVLDE